jgi:hypothetical protein
VQQLQWTLPLGSQVGRALLCHSPSTTAAGPEAPSGWLLLLLQGWGPVSPSCCHCCPPSCCLLQALAGEVHPMLLAAAAAAVAVEVPAAPAAACFAAAAGEGAALAWGRQVAQAAV